ncbi:hypothetical protein RA28_21705 [Ruegeria sp. ANG-S4]|uniref:hypothetical protein n=1 Tax=Ruegeria sp. ANG-S4 TaxID=1577904 RepID=UPI00057CD659|nr:hypothetical protein [Ruegeria sp. ANG-S4]KIC40990.1 hypothetical protein RA28_21705 [Ruegeria sp. ANG-S4]
MSESLLSFSEVLLFGRVIQELQISSLEAKVASDSNIANLKGLTVNGQNVYAGDQILLKDQSNKSENGLYRVTHENGNPWKDKRQFEWGTVIEVKDGTQKGFWRQIGSFSKGRQKFKKVPKRKGQGANNFLSDQLGEGARFARIYGFSYEGTFYDLPEPSIFLVHGDGESATDMNKPGNLAARAPNNPSLGGVAAADYQIADDIRVWDYDKADYTIRMDTMAGQFEQVLLDIYFGFDSPAISGAKVSGAKVSGAKVSGAKVSGAKVSGAKVSGAKARGD